MYVYIHKSNKKVKMIKFYKHFTPLQYDNHELVHLLNIRIQLFLT